MTVATWSVELGNEGVQPRCLCVTNEAVWWVSTTGVLYAWRRHVTADYSSSNEGERSSGGAVPDPLALVQLDARAQFMALSADGTALLLLFSRHLSLFLISRENAPPPFLRDEEEEDMENEDDEAVAVVTVSEAQRWPCNVTDVRGGDVNRDATCAVLCSCAGLYVANCECAERRDSVEEDQRVRLFECAALGASSKGCRFACFSGVSQVVLLDDVNHLLLLHCVLRRPAFHGRRSSAQSASTTVEVLVDGHVLTRTARATALVCSRTTLDTPVVVVGFSTGQVRVLDGASLQQLRAWDVNAVVSRGPASGCGEREKGTTAAPPVLPVLDVQVGAHLFTVSTPQGIYYYNRHSFQLHSEYTVCFQPPLVRLDADAARSAEDQLLFSSALNGSWTYTNVFEGTLYYGPTCVDAQHGLEQRDVEATLDATDTVHARVPLPPRWLKPVGSTSNAPAAAAAAGSRSLVKKGTTAVGVRRPAKGSGYSDAPWSVQQERRRKAQAAATRDSRAAELGLPPAASTKALRFLYTDSDSGPPCCALAAMEAAMSALRHMHTRPVVAATFDTAGSALLTAGADGCAQHLQYPIARSKRTGETVGRALAGHPAAVTAVDANLSRQRTIVLTGCADGKLRLWAPGVQESPVAECMAGVSDAAAVSSVAAPIVAAQFFYLDAFALSCAKDTVELRRHITADASTLAAATTTTAPSKSFIARLEKAPVYSHSVGVTHTITSASAVNHFASNLIVLATSSKELQVLDVAADRTVWCNAETHTRAIYRVAVGRNSRHATTMSNAAAHLFTSASLDGTVALWDLRVCSPVQLYTQHANSAIPSLALELSPGNAMVAVASQDNSVYVYDLRRGGGGATALTVLQGFDTYVTSLAWHPLQPVLAAGLANGAVQLFQHAG